VCERIATRCERLASEIQEMLQLANLQSTAQTPPREAVDLATALRWAIAQVRPMAERREIVIERDLRPVRAVAVADHVKMLFSNLLANAVTYSQHGGRVRVSCAPAGDGQPQVVVADEGIGIAAEKLPHVFEAYYRTNEAVRHNKESTGLGLAIVRHVAETHRLRVRVESAPGAGTTFSLRFPAAPPVPERSGNRKDGDHGLPDDCG